MDSTDWAWVLPYYETPCEHRVRSYQPVRCIHGSLTSTGYGELGRSYESVLVDAPTEEK